ncbi:MAG TPA: DUF6056 family protein [Kofleriaceae bacterium]
MPPAWSWILRALFVVYVTATAIHIGWVLAHEPFSFDAWNVAVDTGGKPFSAGNFFDYWWYEYTHSNPRLGQAFAYLGYKLEWFSVIAAPLAFLALSAAIVVLGTGRLPRWKTGRDLGLWVIAIGFIWLALPQVGKALFNRAYGANYFYTAAIQLWFLVPLRIVSNGRASLGACIAYALFGVVAGMCNEHTGPTLCAFMIGYAWWLYGKTQQRPTLAWAGAFGAVVGFAAIFLAPGQDERYEGLANRVSFVGRVLQRGVVGNLEILRDLVLACAPLLALLLVVLIVAKDDGNERRVAVRRSLNFVAVVAVAALAMAVTIFVSPKLGPRFFYVSTALMLAGFIGVADAVLTRRVLAGFVIAAIAASVYAGARSIPLYERLARAGEARMAALEAAPKGSIFVAEAFEQVDESWWFLGDDFRDPKKRELVAKHYGLAGVKLRAFDPNAPLGVSTVRLVPHAELDPPGCLDAPLELGAIKGFNIASLHSEVKVAIESVRTQIAPAQLRSLDLEVALDVPLPKPRILIARWHPDRFEAYVGRIDRKGQSRTRTVVLPKELAGAEVIVYRVGSEARTLDQTLQYVPWQSGVYWVIACRADTCFVIAASRQGA